MHMTAEESFAKARKILFSKGYDKPRGVQFETTNLCNANCVFCPHPNMKRKKGIMRDEVFNKILSDMKHIIPQRISPFLHGELFMDPNIKHRLETIEEEFPFSEKWISTNGSMLNKERINLLLCLSKLNLTVSLNAADEENHRRMTGIDNFKQITKHLEVLVEKQKEQGFALRISLIAHPRHTQAAIEQFRERWGKYALLCDYDNYAGLLYKTKETAAFCNMTLGNLCVLWNGDVSLCCKDMGGQVVFGNVLEKSLLDLWNSNKFIKYRFCNLYKRKDLLRLCSDCNYLRGRRW